jgi:MFS family permease
VSAMRSHPTGRSLCLASIGWGIAILVAALAPNMVIELIVMLFVGYGSITFNSYAKTVLQLASKPQMRGRVMALWGLAWLGSTPIGGPIVGWVGQEFGARWSLVIGGVPTIVCGFVALPALLAVDRRVARRRAEAAESVDASDAAESVDAMDAMDAMDAAETVEDSEVIEASAVA